MGLRARLAMPVLKFMDGISRIAVPVVSDPVPAVVGTERKLLRGEGGRMARPKTLTSDERTQFFCNWQSFADWRVDEVE